LKEIGGRILIRPKVELPEDEPQTSLELTSWLIISGAIKIISCLPEDQTPDQGVSAKSIGKQLRLWKKIIDQSDQNVEVIFEILKAKTTTHNPTLIYRPNSNIPIKRVTKR
jgi:hypothetical protein